MPLTKAIYASSKDAEHAFYDAIHRADIEAFMNVWAEDEDILCILPGGPRIVGYSNVRETWRHILDGRQRFTMRLLNTMVMPGPLFAVHNLQATVMLAGDNPELQGQIVPILVTNIYIRGALGWRLMVHHASPTQSEGILSEASSTLH